MIRKRIGALALALLGVLGVSANDTLHAQGQDRGGMMGMMSVMQDCPMMHGMAEGPDAALEHREELELSAEQVESLESIQERMAEGRRSAMERMAELHEEIRAVTEAERFDEAAARAAFDRMGDLHVDMGLAMVRSGHEVRSILTTQQREALADLARDDMSMRGMMDMMMECPMMRNRMGGMGMGGHGAEPSVPSER